MSDRWITPAQVRGYMDIAAKGTQEGASAKMGFSRRSAARVEATAEQRQSPNPSRSYRTRSDPFDAVYLPYPARTPAQDARRITPWRSLAQRLGVSPARSGVGRFARRSRRHVINVGVTAAR